MRAKKSLAQHFLHSPSALLAIRDASDVHPGDVALEIGPGRGALTEVLLDFTSKVIAVEKDRELVMYLRKRFSKAISAGYLDLVEQDILDFDPEILTSYKIPYKLVANIPYYITGAIIKKFLSAKCQPELMVLLVQKEVAERIVARDGKESILSLSVRAYGEPHYVATVPRGAFAPPPHVDSAIISINNISRERFATISEEKFFSLVKKGFSSKRKMLKNNIGADSTFFAVCGISEKARAEDVTLEKWFCLASHVS